MPRRSFVCLSGSPSSPPVQDQQNFGAKNRHADRGCIPKVSTHRSNQSRDTESYGHKKPEGCAHASPQPDVLMTAQQEYSRGQQLAPYRFPPGCPQSKDNRDCNGHTLGPLRPAKSDDECYGDFYANLVSVKLRSSWGIGSPHSQSDF
jgi:hypothetical protein